MTNFEFYKDKIMELVEAGNDIALRDGKPVACDDMDCCMCDFGGGACGCSTVKWLYAEHVEKPKINKRTKMFFDAIETGWVARDKDGELAIYDAEPVKKYNNNHWSYSTINGHSKGLNTSIFDFPTLDFIKWEDEKPWRVEDIRNLEVEG